MRLGTVFSRSLRCPPDSFCPKVLRDLTKTAYPAVEPARSIYFPAESFHEQLCVRRLFANEYFEIFIKHLESFVDFRGNYTVTYILSL